MTQVSGRARSWLCASAGGHLVRWAGKEEMAALLRGPHWGRSLPPAPTCHNPAAWPHVPGHGPASGRPSLWWPSCEGARCSPVKSHETILGLTVSQAFFMGAKQGAP